MGLSGQGTLARGRLGFGDWNAVANSLAVVYLK